MIIIQQSIVPIKKEKGQRRKKEGPKKGAMLLSFVHTCASKQHHDIASLIYCASKQHHVLHIESLICCHFHILVGILHYRTWFVYSNNVLPQIALGLREQASWMHTHQFILLSFHTFIALVHPLHGNPYSLTLISIDGHLHSPLICLVDVRLSSPFCLLHNHHSIPPIMLCPWLTLMYCVKIEKV